MATVSLDDGGVDLVLRVYWHERARSRPDLATVPGPSGHLTNCKRSC